MSKDENLGQFKNSNDQDAAYAKTQWQILCAKNGLPQAGDVTGSGINYTNGEAHEARKTMRRAVNAITAKLNPSDYTNELSAGLSHAARVIADISVGLDHFEQKSETASTGIRAMRNAADFQKHYSGEQFNGQRMDDGEFGIADYLRGVANLRTSGAVKNALSTGTDAAGGFTVPGRLMPGILQAMAPASSLMTAGAGIIALDQGAKTFTTAAIDSIPTAAWRLESGALATSDPTFRAVVATPRSLSFQFKMSRELLADGEGIQQALYLAIGQAFAKELDRVGLRGSGVAPEPLGIKGTAGIQAIGNGANGTALAGYSNLFSAVQAILQADAPTPTAAIMSPRSLVRLGGLVDTTGQSVELPNMLSGMKLIASSQVPNTLTVGTSTDCSEVYVADFSHLYFAMRESVSIQMLNELYAGTGEIGFACHMRADTVLTYPQAFALVTGVR